MRQKTSAERTKIPKNAERYWYHVSSTLKAKRVTLTPRANDEGFNRAEDEPDIKRICVCPTIEGCLTAIPYGRRDTLTVYRTTKKIPARKAYDVFDSTVTQESWITKRTRFIRVGFLNLEKITGRNGKRRKVIEEVATEGVLSASRRVFKWWRELGVEKFVRETT